MMNKNPYSAPKSESTAANPGRRWVVLSCGIVFFVYRLLFTNQFIVTSQALYQVKLWRYFRLEVPRLFGPSNLGADSGTRVLTVLFWNLMFSLLFGLAVLGAVGCYRKIANYRRN